MSKFAQWLETVGYDKLPEKAGVYVIRRSRAIKRIGDVDLAGVLYIGRSICLRRRVGGFIMGRHGASWSLLNDKDCVQARIIFDNKIRNISDVKKRMRGLLVQFAEKSDKQIEDAEAALMYAYKKHYGEAPPLNLSIPGNWDEPKESDLRWAEAGIKRD